MQRPRIKGLSRLSPQVHREVLRALDQITRPLTREELDKALVGHLTYSYRRAAVEALANLDIIAIVYRPDETQGA